MQNRIKNRHIVLSTRPEGAPDDSCWDLKESDVQQPTQGQILIRVIYISIDPAMRGWIDDVESYLPPVAIGETMRALGLGQVVATQSDEYQKGDYVSGTVGVQEYALLEADATTAKLDHNIAPLPTYLSVLGMPGMTAYFGLLDVGQPKPGDTILISGAAGAVGAMVGQIAKTKGCRVIGVAGGSKKCAYLVDELGFDAVIDYKAESNLSAALAAKCPDGIDIFFDNVGGEILDNSLHHINLGARIVICGAISQYNNSSNESTKIDYLPILFNSARLEGFVVLNYIPRYAEAIESMSQWLQAGELIAHEDIREGIENFSDTLLELFKGNNFGKLILKVGNKE